MQGKKADEYRATALRFDKRARNVADPITRQRFLDIARGWRELAELTEHSLGGREGTVAA
jgi:hypothetical protein